MSEFEYYWEKAEFQDPEAPRVLTEKEAELDEYFRKYGTSKLQY